MSKRSRRLRRQARKAALAPQSEARADTAESEAEPRADGWENLVSKVGYKGRDKRVDQNIACARIFNTRPELEDLFHGNDLARRICTAHAVEMTRHWISMKIDPNGEPDGEKDGPEYRVDSIRSGGEADSGAELAKDVLEKLDTLKAQRRIAEAITWARLFGGAIVYIGVDDGASPNRTDLPLDLAAVRSVKFLTVLDRHEVRIATRFADPLQDNFGEPELYQIITAGGAMASPSTEGVNRVGQKIHSSRVLSFEGTLTSRFRKRSFNQGWADSVFVGLFDVLRGYGSTWDSAEVLMQDFSQAVIKIKNLAEMMAAHGEDEVMKRLETMDYSRSVLRALIVDAEHEDFERKATPMTGLPELIDRWLHRVASAAEMPISLLFGMSPGGLNATGDADTRFFYDTIKAKQQAELRPQVEYLLRVLFSAQDGPTKGAEPASWSFEFQPLWQMTDEQKANVRKTMADADAQYVNLGVLTEAEVAISRFGGDEFSVETVLDQQARDVMTRAEQAAQQLTDQAAQQAVAAKVAAAGKPNRMPPGAA